MLQTLSPTSVCGVGSPAAGAPPAACWSRVTVLCCMWHCVSRQAWLGGLCQVSGTFLQLLLPTAGDGGIAQLVPCGRGALKVSAALGGRTARNTFFAIHPYRYYHPSICWFYYFGSSTSKLIVPSLLLCLALQRRHSLFKKKIFYFIFLFCFLTSMQVGLAETEANH